MKLKKKIIELLSHKLWQGVAALAAVISIIFSLPSNDSNETPETPEAPRDEIIIADPNGSTFSNKNIFNCYDEDYNNALSITTASKSPYRDIIKLLSTDLNSTCFDISPLPNNEIILNNIGKYYSIKLKMSHIQTKNASEKRTIYFSCGEYYRPLADKEFGESIKSLVKLLNGIGEYKLYLRGNADIGGHCNIGKGFVKPYVFNEIGLHMELNQTPLIDEKYEEKTSLLYINEPITNKLLPNLRASFIRDIFSRDIYQISPKPEILNGRVTSSVENHKDRNVEIFLYLK